MKKPCLFLVVLFISILVTGCQTSDTRVSMNSYDIETYEVNQYTDAAMVIIEDSISSTGLTLELYYYGEDEGLTGTWYTLFAFIDDEWTEMSYITEENVYWPMIGYNVSKNQATEMSIGWSWLYGELSSGRYLIIKEFTNHRNPGDNDYHYLACEFTLA